MTGLGAVYGALVGNEMIPAAADDIVQEER